MAKLHELLAVDSNLRGQAEATRKELINTFEKRRTHFSEIIKTFKSNEEGHEDVVESKMGLQTTVGKEIAWISEKIGKAINTGHQIDEANTAAREDVILEDGRRLLSKVPATSLLQIEKRLKEVQGLIEAIPTLDPAKGFEADTQRGAGIFKARDVIKPRTHKTEEFIVVVPPTDKHPAHVEKKVYDKVIGEILEQEWSSLLTISGKGDMLDRVEALIRAVKAARSRANEQTVDTKENRIADALLSFVFDGT